MHLKTSLNGNHTPKMDMFVLVNICMIKITNMFIST